MISTALLLLSLIAQQGVVSGRVFDAENGEPLKGINVCLLRKTYDQFGILQIVSLQAAVTNDEGEYRITDVSALRSFYVGASGPEHRSAYYPAVTELSAAVPLDVLPGQELTGIDLKLSRGRRVKIRGRMLDALHVRQPHLSSVRLLPRHDPLYQPNKFPSYRVAPDGAFEILDVPPGSYYVVGQRIDDEPNRSRTVVPIEVENDDIEDFELIAAEGHDIRGRIRVEGATIEQLMAGQPVRLLNVVLKPIADPASLIESPPAVRPDGTFLIPGLPSGEYRLSISGLPADLYMKSARFGPVDVLESGISLRGVVAGSLDVVLSSNGGRIAGSVVGGAGKTVGGSYVFLVPEIARIERSDLYKSAVTDADGRFTLSGIAPGRYQIFTSQDFDPYTYRDPAFINRFKDRSHRLNVEAGELVTVELTRMEVQ